MNLKNRLFHCIALLSLTFFVLVAPALAVEFNYQGQVTVKGTPFSGTGQFKLAIVNEAGDTTLWSNDGASASGSEPEGHFSVAVSEGVFNIVVGDETIAGMAKLTPSIFNTKEPLYLRVWFSDGENGFQRLLPDRRITNTDLLGLRSDAGDIDLYVNATSGNDAHSGLKPSHAKKTIQAAVDAIPGRLQCNATVHIAEGVYREQVKLYGINVEPDHLLTLEGDTSWTLASSADPVVRITGCDDDSTHAPVRKFGIFVEQCSRIHIKGVLVDYVNNDGMRFMQCSSIKVLDSVSRQNGRAPGIDGPNAGIKFYQANGEVHRCLATDNAAHGMYWGSVSAGQAYDCKSTHNEFGGITVHAGSTLGVLGNTEVSNNAHYGLYCMHNSMLFLDGNATLHIRNNGESGIALLWQSYSQGHPHYDYAGNPQNVIAYYGSAAYE